MIDNTEALAKLQRIRVAIEDGGLDQPVEIAAWRTRTGLIEATPKRWTGLTRNSWQMVKTGSGERVISNKSKVMLFLEEGTGKTTGGYIYPKSKKFLFIPKTSTAAVGGWRAGMKWGIDFILARRVRGIQAMQIVQKFRPRAAEILREEVKAFLQRIIR